MPCTAAKSAQLQELADVEEASCHLRRPDSRTWVRRTYRLVSRWLLITYRTKYTHGGVQNTYRCDTREFFAIDHNLRVGFRISWITTFM
jgi:hypothetical protein